MHFTLVAKYQAIIDVIKRLRRSWRPPRDRAKSSPHPAQKVGMTSSVRLSLADDQRGRTPLWSQPAYSYYAMRLKSARLGRTPSDFPLIRAFLRSVCILYDLLKQECLKALFLRIHTRSHLPEAGSRRKPTVTGTRLLYFAVNVVCTITVIKTVCQSFLNSLFNRTSGFKQRSAFGRNDRPFFCSPGKVPWCQ